MKYSKEEQIEAVTSYLIEGWNVSVTMADRADYMMREASKFASGHPEWSDIYGTVLKPIDDVRKMDLIELIDEALKICTQQPNSTGPVCEENELRSDKEKLDLVKDKLFHVNNGLHNIDEITFEEMIWLVVQVEKLHKLEGKFS